MSGFPIKKTMLGPATFAAGVAQRGEASEAVRTALTGELEEAGRSFFEAIERMEVLELSPNGTGRRITVKARLLGRIIRFSVSPFEGHHSQPRPRTRDGLLNEVVQRLADKRLRGSATLSAEPLSYLLLGYVRDEVKEFVARHSVIAALCDQAQARLRTAGGPRRLHDAVQKFVESGSHLGNFDSHQRQKALSSFREMACHALKHGMTVEELEAALREEVVRATMEV